VPKTGLEYRIARSGQVRLGWFSNIKGELTSPRGLTLTGPTGSGFGPAGPRVGGLIGLSL